MSERKVLNKYYPPDFDPSKIPRLKRISKQHKVRTMAPFNMKCNTCGDYIAKARKFNARKETVEDESYKGLSIYRFYIKCPKCMAEITFKTDLKEADYVIEHGATQNFMALKMAEKQAENDAIAEEEEEKINPMKHLENRTNASKNEMEASEQIQNLRLINQRQISVDFDSLIADSKQSELLEDQRQKEEDLLLAKSIMAQRKASVLDPQYSTNREVIHEEILEEEQISCSSSSSLASSSQFKLNPAKKAKLSGLTIKPKSSKQEESTIRQLCDYSDSDEDD